MKPNITLSDVLATATGITIAAAIANANIEAQHADGAHALMIYALAAGIVAGSAVIGRAITARRYLLAAAIFAALVAGECANVLATGDRLVTAREAGAAPLKAAKNARQEAQDRLAGLEAAAPATSARTATAERAVEAATADYHAEAANIACKKECLRKQGLKTAAEAELRAAQAADALAHAEAIKAARATLAGIEEPPSATPLADRTGIPAWKIDIALALLYALGCNGLAGALVAYGTHGSFIARSDSRSSSRPERAVPRIVPSPEPGALVSAMAAAGRFVPQAAPEALGRDGAAETFAALKAAALSGSRFPLPEHFPAPATFSGPLPEPVVSGARFPENDPPLPPGGGRKRKSSQPLPANVIPFGKHPVVQALENAGGSVASNRQLARLMGVSDGESSKRWPEIEHLLVVEKVGKNRRIALRR